MTTSILDRLPVTNLDEQTMYRDPYPTYRRLRTQAPVSRVKVPFMIAGTGYMLTRYADVETMHSDERYSTNLLQYGAGARFQWLLPPSFRLLQEAMVFHDEPDHKRLRTLVHKAFTPKLVMSMTDRIAEISAELIDGMARKRDVDLMEDFAIQLPLAVIASILGVPQEDRDRFHALSREIMAVGPSSVMGMIRYVPASRRLLKFFDHLVEQARSHPNDGLVSGLVNEGEDGDKLSHREVLAMVYLLLLAGHDTTSNLIGNSAIALVNNPDQLARLRSDPAIIDTGIEELLRYTTPVACGTTRIALADVELSGTVIPKGSQVLGMIISANRDETVFPDPDVLDLGRNPNRHLTFAFGPHYCLGHQLARSEGKIALTQLLERFGDLQITVPQERLQYKRTPALRGVRALPMRVS